MTKLKSTIAWSRAHISWLALAVLPLVAAACNNGGSGGNGY
jgi:hypothetical protein